MRQLQLANHETHFSLGTADPLTGIKQASSSAQIHAMANTPPTRFISIDCGSTTPYTDANNISWVPDTTYISTGQNYNAQDVASNESSTLKTLRYFPENQAKNCYVLPVTFNQTYLIRASFLFTKSFLTAAGYNTSSSTTFYYSIDPNLISMLEFSTANSASLQDAFVLETVLASTSDKFYVCLARSTSTDVPFISSLELRQLYDGMYADRVYSGYYLDLVNRANWGSSTPVVSIKRPGVMNLWRQNQVVGSLQNHRYLPHPAVAP
ncbi:unnamed protein product [Sphagnum balticum]